MTPNATTNLRTDSDVNTLVFRDPTDTDITPKKVIALSIMSVSNVFMLLGNGFSIYIILCSSSLRRYTYYWLVLNLAVLDLMNASFVVPINIVWEYYGNWPFSQTLCDLEIFFDLGFGTMAAYSTVLLSLDKYLYITKPFFYHTYVGPKMTLGSIVASWVIWMTYAALSVFGGLARSTKDYKYDYPLDNCNFVLTHVYAVTSFILLFFIPLLILIFVSSRILYVVHQHLKKIQTNHRVSDATTVSVDISTNSPNIGRNVSSSRPSLWNSSSDTQTADTREERDPVSSNCHLQVTITTDKQAWPGPATSASEETEGSSSANSDTRTKGKNTPAKRNTITNTFRAFGTVTLVVLAYIIMFGPYWIASVVNLGCICIEPMIFEDYLTVFCYMHSLVNPYIYMATDRRFKKAIRLLMARSRCCRRCKGGSVSPGIHISYINH